jgi:type I restriction enzyme S subunit
MSFGGSIADLVENSNIPLLCTAPSWLRIELKNVVSITNGYPWKSSGFKSGLGKPVVRIRNVISGDTDTYYDGEVVEGYWVIAGDLLVGMDGDFNRNYWNGPDALLNQRVCKLEPDEKYYIKDFLFRALPPYLKLINDHTSSVTVKHLSSKTLGEIPLPLPPLAEQKRIVAKLDALSARSARARKDLSRIDTLVTRYKQAVLSKAFLGVSETRFLGDLISEIKAGKNLRCEERPPRLDEKGVIKVSAVTWGEFKPDQSKTLPPDFDPPEETLIRDGDFLFSRANTIELVGAVVIVANAPENLYLSDKVLRLTFSEEIDDWVLWYLRSPEGREALMEVSSGNQLSMRNISQKNLNSLRVPYADEPARQAIVRRIESAFQKIDRLAAEAKRALELTDKLDEAILAKAFRGELVPQDPTDEPASRLLERIKAERAAAPKAKRGRKKANG